LHGFAEVVGQRQTQPGPAELPGNAGAGLREGLEDLDLGVLGDADAGVADFDSDAVLECRQAHIDPTEAGEFEGVGQQVADDLSDSRRIPKHQGRKLRVDQAAQLDTRRGVLR